MKVKPIVLGELSSFDTDNNDGVFSRSNLCSPDVADSTPPSSGFSDHEDCGFADEFGAVLFEELGVLCCADLDPEIRKPRATFVFTFTRTRSIARSRSRTYLLRCRTFISCYKS